MTAPALVGIEHELAVLGPDGLLDAHVLEGSLDVLGPRLRRSRPSTVRLSCGAEVSWEDGDIELASPPLPVSAGVIDELVAWMGTAAGEALAVLPPDLRLEGRSTHLSLSAPDEWLIAACGQFAYRFAPALIVLSEGTEGEGILLRPRFGRLEVGTDYVRGDALRAVAALTIGGVLASVDAARGAIDESALPPVVDVRVEGATRRFGWFVPVTPVVASTAGRSHVERAWSAARRALAPFVADTDLRIADDVVAGRHALSEEARDRAPEPTPAEPRRHPLGAVVSPIVTPRLTALVTDSDWSTSVVEITEHGVPDPPPPPRSAPEEAVARAARAIERGAPPVARTPIEPAAVEAAVFAGLADPARFVTSARVPATALSTVAGFLYERVWPRPRRKPMPRKYRLIGGLLLSAGLGIAVGGLLPPRSAERASAAPAAVTSDATRTPSETVETAPATTSSRPTAAATSPPTCRVVSTVSHVRTDAIDGGWIVLFPVEVRDQDGQVVVGATVQITNAKSDGTSTSARGQTGPRGIVPFGVRTTQPGTNSIEVTAVEVPGCDWDKAASVSSATGSAP